MNGRFRLPVYVFFFALLPVLSLLSTNINQIAFVEGLRAAVLVVVVGGGLLLLIGRRTGEWHRGGLAVSLFLLFFLSFGHIYKAFIGITGSENTDSTYAIVAAAWLLLTAGLVLLIWFGVKQPQRLTQNLNVISLVMLLPPLFGLVSSLAAGKTSAFRPEAGLTLPEAAQNSPDRPDVYYIVLDGYARADVLAAVFQFDNSPFLNELAERGFYIAPDSHTNYLSTIPSLASSLNFQYLDELAAEMGPQSRNLPAMHNMIQNNRIQYFLDSLNYDSIAISSGFNNSEVPEADYYLAASLGGVNDFETLLLQHVPGGAYFVQPGKLLPNGLQYDPHRARIRFAFDSLAHTVPDMKSPKFVFAHIVTPHPPFVFGAEGETIQPDYAYTLSDGSHYPGTAEAYVEGYRNQIIYTNKLLLETVDEILSQSQSPPIIVIQSDHGSGAFLEWDRLEDNTCLKERAANFTAILAPGSAVPFYDSITPINIFPILFNGYFDTDFALLPDKTFFVIPTKPFDFTDITSQIGGSDACLTG